MVRNKTILMVLTSQTTMGDSDAPTGFWMEELATPFYQFREAGFSVKLASARGGETQADPRSLADESQTESTRRFLDDSEAIRAIKNTVPLSEVRSADFDAVVFPGGHGPMFDLAVDKNAGKLASEFYADGKVVAAFCHGPAALVTAADKNGQPLVSGKRVTGFSNAEEDAVGLMDAVPFLLEDKLKELGADYSAGEPWQPHVVVAGNLITGQNPASAAKMARAILEQLD